MIVRDSVILITGASSGIGRAAAEALAAKGARLLVHGRDEAALAELAGRLGAIPLVADLSRPGAATRLAETALARAGHVDVLIANAGQGWCGPFAGMGDDAIERLVEVNLTASVRLTRALLPGMVARGHGRLVYVTSIAGRTGVAGESVYAAAKAGLDAFAESLRLELRDAGVGVGVLVPGVVATQFFERRGRPYGRRRPKPIEAGPLGARLARMIERGEDEVYRPAWLRLGVAARAVWPRAYRMLAGRFGAS